MRQNRLFHTLVLGTAAALLAATPVSASYGTVTADILSIRTAPSVESDIVGSLNWGDDVAITYVPSNDWYEIYVNDGCYYVSSDFVICNGEPEGADAIYGYEDVAYTYEADYDTSVEYIDDTSVSVEEESDSHGTYLGHFTLTAYCGCATCCGTAGNLTASGTVPTAGRTVAMGDVPFGTKLLINGTVYTVEDRGTAYGTVDIFFNSHSEAIAFGMQSADVYQVE